MKNSPIDVLSLSETWCDQTIDDSELFIQDYDLFRKDRDRHSGGVCIYIKQKYVSSTIPELNNYPVEGIWIRVTLPCTNPFVIGAIYRPPSSSLEFFRTLDSVLVETPSLRGAAYP